MLDSRDLSVAVALPLFLEFADTKAGQMIFSAHSALSPCAPSGAGASR
jgi:hypothetical protein